MQETESCLRYSYCTGCDVLVEPKVTGSDVLRVQGACVDLSARCSGRLVVQMV